MGEVLPAGRGGESDRSRARGEQGAEREDHHQKHHLGRPEQTGWTQEEDTAQRQKQLGVVGREDRREKMV